MLQSAWKTLCLPGIKVEEEMLCESAATHAQKQKQPAQQCDPSWKKHSPVDKIVREDQDEYEECHCAQDDQCLIPACVATCSRVKAVLLKDCKRQERPEWPVGTNEAPKMQSKSFWVRRLEDFPVNEVPNHKCKDH